MIVRNIDVKEDYAGENVTRKVLAYSKNIMSVEVIFKKGSIGALHTHPHEQISYVAEGKFEYEINGEKHIIEKGDSCYVAGGLNHGVVCLEDGILLDIFTPQREDFLNKE